MIWEEEQVPDDWTKGILVKLPKKDDRSICGNCRGIMLLSIHSKLLCRIILHRMKKEMDRVSRVAEILYTLHSLILRRHLIV